MTSSSTGSRIAALIQVVYLIGVPVSYVYLTVHDWPLVSGWRWLGMDAFNGFRAAIWPLYLLLSLVFFGGLLPPDRL